MDLNVAPTSDEDKEERVESAVDTMRREREERRLRMKRKREEEPLEARNYETSVVRQAPQLRVSSRTAGLNLPEGWLDCPSMGEPIAGLFIPSKVPLGERFNEVIPHGKRFSKFHVLRTQRTRQREVALVIDLTNTNRYYSPQEWLSEGVKHVKVPCRGRGEVPEPEAVNQFVYEVIKFRRTQHYVDSSAAKAPDKRYVLVHCTHGHNRTGFMIVHYLVRTQHISVETAVRLFAEARPPGIYKLDYIESLYKFYNERRPEPLPCPRTPEWKRRPEVGPNGEARGDDDDDDGGGILAARQEESVVRPTRMTNDDVLGDAIPEEQQLEMQTSICRFLGVNSGKQPRFPGSHPVSLDKKNLQLLRQRHYYVTWKADGTRYMMFLTRFGCYLIDRNFRFRAVQLRFPVAKTSKDAMPDFHDLTLLDGEMVIDTVPGSAVQLRRYLAYDLMILNGRALRERPFSERWKLVKDKVCDPRSEEKQRGGRYMYEAEKFSVRRKDFWMLNTVGKLLTHLIPQKLSHEADGLIFQGWADVYVPRTHEGLLKWKYARLNSVDFQLQVSSSGQYQLLLMERGGKFKQLDGARVTFPADDQDPSTMVGKIIECSWNPEENQWEFMRIRKDKETPNAWHVYEKVLASLHDKITEEVLLEEIKEICQLPMYADSIAIIKREQEQRASRAGR